MLENVHAKLHDLLRSTRYREVSHAHEGRSDAVAALRGHDPHIAAKALVLSTRESKKAQKYYLAVIPGDWRLSFDKVKAHTGKRASMAPLSKVQELTGCAPGAVPPFSFHDDLTLLVDPEMARQQPEIVFNAGRLDRSIFLNTEDYLTTTKPMLVDISSPEKREDTAGSLELKHDSADTAAIVQARPDQDPEKSLT